MTLLKVVQCRVAVVLLALLACSVANAQVEKYVAGTHYTVVPALPALQELQRVGDTPSVTEIFWYGCPHCYAFDPLLESWVAKQGAAINFIHIPLSGNAVYRQHARLFYAAQALGFGTQLHQAIFDTIQQQHNRLTDEAAAQKFFAEHGVAADKFAAAWKSFSMDTTLRKHEAEVMALKVPSVPLLLVNGKYMVEANEAVPSHEKMLEVVEFLLHKK